MYCNVAYGEEDSHISGWCWEGTPLLEWSSFSDCYQCWELKDKDFGVWTIDTDLFSVREWFYWTHQFICSRLHLHSETQITKWLGYSTTQRLSLCFWMTPFIRDIPVVKTWRPCDLETMWLSLSGVWLHSLSVSWSDANK